jgi:hypothetical protein
MSPFQPHIDLEGVLRGYLSELGREAKDAAIYWKYGLVLRKDNQRSQVLIESKWEASSEAGAGDSRYKRCRSVSRPKLSVFTVLR